MTHGNRFKVLAILPLAIATACITGCSTASTAAPVASSKTANYNFTVYSLNAAGNSPQSVTNGETKITCTSVSVKPKYSNATFMKARSVFDLDFTRQTGMEAYTFPVPVAPEGMALNFEITNLSKHKADLGDVSLVVKINGAPITLDPDDYEEIQTGIVGGETHKATAPIKVSGLSEGDAVTVELHDVVVQANEAGVPAKKENFKWDFKFAKKQSVEICNVTRTNIKFVSSDERMLFKNVSMRAPSGYVKRVTGGFIPADQSEVECLR